MDALAPGLAQMKRCLRDLHEAAALIHRGCSESIGKEEGRELCWWLVDGSAALSQAADDTCDMFEGLTVSGQDAMNSKDVSVTVISLLLGQWNSFFQEYQQTAKEAQRSLRAVKLRQYGAVAPAAVGRRPEEDEEEPKEKVGVKENSRQEANSHSKKQEEEETTSVREKKKEKKDKKDKKEKKEKKRKEKERKEAEEAGSAAAVASTTVPIVANSTLSPDEFSQQQGRRRETTSSPPVQPPPPVEENHGLRKAQTVEEEHSGDKEGDGEEIVPEKYTSVPHAGASMEDVMGPVVASVRGESLSPISKLLSTGPVLTYAVECPSLSHFLVGVLLSDVTDSEHNNRSGEEETPHDEYFNEIVLGEDTLSGRNSSFEVPTSSGELITEKGNGKLVVSSCGWRRLFGSSNSLLTFYAFVDHFQKGKCLLIQEVMEPASQGATSPDTTASSSANRNKRREVMHLVSLQKRDNNPSSDNNDSVSTSVSVTSYAVTSASSRRRKTGITSEEIAARFKSLVTSFFEEVPVDVKSPLVPPSPITTKHVEAELASHPPLPPPMEKQTKSEAAAAVEESEGSTGKKIKQKMGFLARTIGFGKSIVASPMTATMAAVDVASGALRTTQLSLLKKSFPDIEEEDIAEIYNCAWKDKTVLRQGYLYTSESFICFCATILNGTFLVEMEEINEINKAKTAVVFDNAVEIRTHSGEKYFLSSFLQRDEAHKTLYTRWIESSSLR